MDKGCIYGLWGLTVNSSRHEFAWHLDKTICRIFGCLLSQSIQLVLNCETHKHRHHNTPGQCHHWLYSDTFLNFGTQILKNLTVTVCNDYIITWSEGWKQVPSMSRNTVNLTLPELLITWYYCWNAPIGLLLVFLWFKMMTPCLIAQQDLQYMHHLQYGISINVPTITNRQHSLCALIVCVCTCAGRHGN